MWVNLGAIFLSIVLLVVVVLRTDIGYMYIMINSHTCNAAIFEWFNLVNSGGKYVTSAGTPG